MESVEDGAEVGAHWKYEMESEHAGYELRDDCLHHISLEEKLPAIKVDVVSLTLDLIMSEFSRLGVLEDEPESKEDDTHSNKN